MFFGLRLGLERQNKKFKWFKKKAGNKIGSLDLVKTQIE